MSDTIGKAELIDLIQTERARLEALLGQLTEAQLAQPGVAGDWSAKDIMAHLAFWEQKMLQRTQAVVRGERPEILRVEGEEWETTMNRINDQNFAANRARPLPEVQADFQRSYEQVLAVMEGITDDDLAETSPATQLLGRPLHDLISGDTYEHYREHGDAIRAWVEKQP
jgi:uncharacterized protein (TIGR03083 family)